MIMLISKRNLVPFLSNSPYFLLQQIIASGNFTHLIRQNLPTIQCNIERDLNNCPCEKFILGDSVLVKSPGIKPSGVIATKDSFAPIDVVGELVEVLLGRMYKSTLPNGADFCQKNIFLRGVVLFKETAPLSYDVA